MSRRSFLRRAPHNQDMSLQITSLADVFVILLVFLLKSYGSGMIDIVPANGTKLPVAAVSDPGADALKVEVSENSVLIEGKAVAQIENFSFRSSDLETDGSSSELVKALDVERSKPAKVSPQVAKAAPAAAGAAGEKAAEQPQRMILIADQRAPYATIKTVLASAASRGYTDIKLAVTHAE